jgi:hypothetical protein
MRTSRRETRRVVGRRPAPVKPGETLQSADY